MPQLPVQPQIHCYFIQVSAQPDGKRRSSGRSGNSENKQLCYSAEVGPRFMITHQLAVGLSSPWAVSAHLIQCESVIRVPDLGTIRNGHACRMITQVHRRAACRFAYMKLNKTNSAVSALCSLRYVYLDIFIFIIANTTIFLSLLQLSLNCWKLIGLSYPMQLPCVVSSTRYTMAVPASNHATSTTTNKQHHCYHHDHAYLPTNPCPHGHRSRCQLISLKWGVHLGLPYASLPQAD
jgi:hypothetical protein